MVEVIIFGEQRYAKAFVTADISLFLFLFYFFKQTCWHPFDNPILYFCCILTVLSSACYLPCGIFHGLVWQTEGKYFHVLL